jgi:hypothetical protein
MWDSPATLRLSVYGNRTAVAVRFMLPREARACFITLSQLSAAFDELHVDLPSLNSEMEIEVTLSSENADELLLMASRFSWICSDFRRY